MKCCKEDMKVTLTVLGREMTFTRYELTSILEEYFQDDFSVKTPIENKWFIVDPKTIKEEIFQQKREDKNQEETRQLILEAFENVRSNPEKYGRIFESLMPDKNWIGEKTVNSIKSMAKHLGDHNADWVELALQWAQRICNGETWEKVCNNNDTAKYFRMVIWKNGCARLVGGSAINGFDFPATYIFYNDYYLGDCVYNTVPMVIRYVSE